MVWKGHKRPKKVDTWLFLGPQYLKAQGHLTPSNMTLSSDDTDVLNLFGRCGVSQLGQMAKTLQKLDWKIREIDGPYFSLQQFYKFWICGAQNVWIVRTSIEFAESCLEKSVKLHQVNLFKAGFSCVEPLCVSGLWC